jgi:hypothetical protein
METDGQILKQSGTMLDHAGDVADETTRTFEHGSVIDTSSWGGGGIPLDWNIAKRLSDFVDGPYRDIRGRMIAAMDYAGRIMRANADAVIAAANTYIAAEDDNTHKFQARQR